MRYTGAIFQNRLKNNDFSEYGTVTVSGILFLKINVLKIQRNDLAILTNTDFYFRFVLTNNFRQDVRK